MRSRTFALAVTPVAVALLMGACKDASDSEIASAPIGPDGGTLTSVDSILTIAIVPGALEETITLTIQRSDEPPEVYGPAFRVQPNPDLAIPATVTYRYELPEDTSETAIGYVDAAEFADGQGRWRPLEVIQIEPSDKLIKASDPQISLFYGLLDSTSDIPTTGTATGTTATPTNTSTPPTTGTTGDPDGSDSGTTTTDPDTSAGPTTTTDPGDSSSTGGEEGSSEGSTTGNPFGCGNLPMGPLVPQEFMFDGSPLDDFSEDMTFSTIGSIITRNGGDLVQISPAGAVSVIPTMVALPETLGLRWTPAGNIVTVGRYTGELLEIQPDGTVTVLLDGLQFPNGVFVYQDGTIFFTEFDADRASWVNATGGMLTELGLGMGEAPEPNGIVYDPDRDLVFYSSYFTGEIWRVDVTDLNNPGVPTVISTIPSLGGGDLVGLDGVTLDECGNLYIVDQNQGNPGSLYRLELDAAGDPLGAPEALVEMFPQGVANAVFAQGPGWGMYDTTLFVIGLPGYIYTVDVGVAGAPTPAG